jgi:uncharacterized protein with von Willebrand factor type A (vWA) domain
MGRSKKTVEKWHSYTFYINDKFLPIWEDFIRIVDKDKGFNALKYKSNPGVISLAIRQMIAQYVRNQKNLTTLLTNISDMKEREKLEQQFAVPLDPSIELISKKKDDEDNTDTSQESIDSPKLLENDKSAEDTEEIIEAILPTTPAPTTTTTSNNQNNKKKPTKTSFPIRK